MPLLVWLLLLAAPRQDAVQLNPRIVKVEFENHDIRVLRVHYEAHEQLAMHEDPAKLAVCVNGALARISGPDGKISESRSATGDFSWSEPVRHAVENLSDQPLEFVEVEFKRASAPGVAVALEPRLTYAEEPKDPVPVQFEPHHHPKFQNQYVRVMDVVLAPGESSYFHKHTYDSVAVILSNSTSQNQLVGEEWGGPRSMTVGQVGFTEDSKKPRLHRLKNVGNTTLHIVDLDILR